MDVAIQTLIRSAHLFAGVLAELQSHDGWLSFESDFAKFVTAQGIEWWTLYEQPTQLRIVIGAVLFTPAQWKSFAHNPNRREVIIRETFALVDDSREWEASFGTDIDAALGRTPVTQERQKMAMERVELLCAALVANLYNYLAVMVFGQSLCQLVAHAREGSDDALIHAAQVDRTVLNLPHFRQRLAQAQLTGDSNFLDMLSYRLRNPLLRTKLRHPELRLAFAILQDEGELEPGKRRPYSELMDLCREAKVYEGDDVDAFRKNLTEYLRAQRKRKDF